MTSMPRLAGLLVALVVSFATAWQVQGCRYGQQLAEPLGLHRDNLMAISNAATAQIRADQYKRLARAASIGQ